MPKNGPLTPASVAALPPAERRRTLRRITLSCVLCALAGVIMLGASGWLTKERLAFLDTAIETEARVIDRVVTRSAGGGANSGPKTTYRPTFEFTDERGVTRVGGPTSSNSAWDWPVGATVTVRYDPANPADVRPKSGIVSEWLAQIVLALLGSSFFFGSLVMLYAFHRQPGREDVVIN